MSLEEIIINFLLRIFNNPKLPVWVSTILIIGTAIFLTYLGIANIIEKWRTVFAPIFYNNLDKRRGKHRKYFALNIFNEINLLNNQQQWKDYRFSELEAEVEAEGDWKPRGWLYRIRKPRIGLRREKSLSKALETSRERLILLEGDPGSGKSIALRHLAYKLSLKASKSNSAYSLIPIYINLRGLERLQNQKIDRQFIYEYVTKSLNRINDRDIEEFLEQEFSKGLKEGTWIFFFDSFDEIPEILSSTEADEAIQSYSSAIIDFMHGLNLCRGILASRNFRGPTNISWPRFRILPLSESRQYELLRKVDLPSDKEKELIGGLPFANQEIKSMSSNPMFLGLLCEHVRLGNKLPQNGHAVFESYVNSRLMRDKNRLEKRFSLSPEEIRPVGENLAFCMTLDSEIGLSPSREELLKAMQRQNFEVGPKFNQILDALEYIKLARSDNSATIAKGRVFEFSHRRFQEYFATCVVLRSPKIVKPIDLILNARWRETCITLFQTQPMESLIFIINEMNMVIQKMAGVFENISDMSQQRQGDYHVFETISHNKFHWPDGSLHILSLIQEGFNTRVEILPKDLTRNVGNIMQLAWKEGILLDRKWVMDVARAAPEKIFIRLIRNALESRSQWLRNIAHKQLSCVGTVTKEVEVWIREMIIELVASGRFYKERFATYSFLARLPKSDYFISIHTQILATYLVTSLFYSVYVIFFLWTFFLPAKDQINLVEDTYATGLISGGILGILFSSIIMPRKTPHDLGVTCFMKIIVGTVLIVIPTHSISLKVYMVILGYLLLWSPSVILLIERTAAYTKLLYWPWTPFILLKEVITPLFSTSRLRDYIRWFRNLIIFLVISTGFVLAFPFLIKFYNTQETVIKEAVNIIIKYFLPAFIVIFGIPMLAFLAKEIRIRGWHRFRTEMINGLKENINELVQDLRDLSGMGWPWSERLRYNNWKNTRKTMLTPFEFLDSIAYRDPKYCIKAFQDILDQNLLKSSRESEATLRTFIQLSEYAKQKRALTSRRSYESIRSYIDNLPKEFQDRFSNFREARKLLLIAYHVDSWDKINQLLESIHNEIQKK